MCEKERAECLNLSLQNSQNHMVYMDGNICIILLCHSFNGAWKQFQCADMNMCENSQAKKGSVKPLNGKTEFLLRASNTMSLTTATGWFVEVYVARKKNWTDSMAERVWAPNFRLPASIVFITLFGIGKETIWLGTMRWCFDFSSISIIVINWCCGCGPWFRLCSIIIPVCFAMQKVRIPCWWCLLWCNQT